MGRLWLLGAALLPVFLAQVSPGVAQDKPYGVRGTLVEVDDQLLTVMNDDEETFEVALTEETDAFAVTPAKWSDLRPGQFIGITSVESGSQRVAPAPDCLSASVQSRRRRSRSQPRPPSSPAGRSK